MHLDLSWQPVCLFQKVKLVTRKSLSVSVLRLSTGIFWPRDGDKFCCLFSNTFAGILAWKRLRLDTK